jgi:hydrogenase nickel incorporation protein HypA/HybF
MHEMSIIESLLEAVNKERQAYPTARVVSLRVRVGALRLVVPEVMESCYAAATLGTTLAGSRLELETAPARARCPQCRHEFAVEEQWFECPQCCAVGGELLRGQELDLVNIELEDSVPVTSCPS